MPHPTGLVMRFPDVANQSFVIRLGWRGEGRRGCLVRLLLFGGAVFCRSIFEGSFSPDHLGCFMCEGPLDR